MDRPRNLSDHGEPDAAALASVYAWASPATIPSTTVTGAPHRSSAKLPRTQRPLEASDAEVVIAFVALAAGELSEDELADWFRERMAEG